MPFGKYRGLDVEDLPDTYLEWLRSLDDLRGPLRGAVNDEWRARQWETHSRDDAVADLVGDLDAEDRTLLGELIRVGYRQLAKTYHPDTGGDPEIMTRLNRLVEKLRGGLAA
jgi:hypothetical protein